MIVIPPMPKTPEAFEDWMDEESFSNETLGAALHCSRATVWKWRSGKHPLDWVTWVACVAVAGTERDRQARLRAIASIEEAKEQAAEIVRNARSRARDAVAS